MDLTPHEQKILDLVKKHPEVLDDRDARAKLAEEIGLSEKTLRNRIADLKKYGELPTGSDQPVKVKPTNFIGTLTKIFSKKWIYLRNGFIISIVAVIIALIMPQTFTSRAVLLPPEWFESNQNSFLPMLTGGIASAFGISGEFTESRFITAYLDSRTLRKEIINKFDLINKYEVENVEYAIETINEFLSYRIEENGTITVQFSGNTGWVPSSVERDSVRNSVFKIDQYILEKLDILYQNTHRNRALTYRKFYEDRYHEINERINSLENEIVNFETKNEITDVKTQLEGLARVVEQQLTTSLNLTKELELLKYQKQIEFEIVSKSRKVTSPEVENAKMYVDEVTNKLDEVYATYTEIDTNLLRTVFPKFKNSSEIAMQWFRYKKEMEILQSILTVIVQKYEEYKLSSLQDIPQIEILDTPSLPIRKSSPKRVLLVLIICILYAIYIWVKESILVFFSVLKSDNYLEYERYLALFNSIIKK